MWWFILWRLGNAARHLCVDALPALTINDDDKLTEYLWDIDLWTPAGSMELKSATLLTKKMVSP